MEFLLAKSFFLASLTSLYGLVRSLRSTTNLPMQCIVSSWMLTGVVVRVTRESVSSGNEFHVAQADFLPYPMNTDTMSHPVMA